MLFSNLNVLLAERNLKVSKVSKDTGISRTTLTSLCNNYSQGIQFETLNTLCSYLRITPSNFFCYIPIDYQVNISRQSKDIYTVDFEIFQNHTTEKATALIYIDIDNNEKSIAISLVPSTNKDDNTNILDKLFSELPATAISIIEESIYSLLDDELKEYETFDVTYINKF